MCRVKLCVKIDNNLKWLSQINHVSKKLNMKVNLLKRLAPFLTMEMKKLFYNAYILSHFDYCCVVWANGTKSYLNKLYAIQKRTARLVLMKPNRTPSQPLFNTLRWLTFNNRYKYHTGVWYIRQSIIRHHRTFQIF